MSSNPTIGPGALPNRKEAASSSFFCGWIWCCCCVGGCGCLVCRGSICPLLNSCWRPPQEPEALWTFIHELSDAERLELLAHCVSLTANAIRAPRQRSGRAGTRSVSARDKAQV
jgi:hypothetical protein